MFDTESSCKYLVCRPLQKYILVLSHPVSSETLKVFGKRHALCSGDFFLSRRKRNFSEQGGWMVVAFGSSWLHRTRCSSTCNSDLHLGLWLLLPYAFFFAFTACAPVLEPYLLSRRRREDTILTSSREVFLSAVRFCVSDNPRLAKFRIPASSTREGLVQAATRCRREWDPRIPLLWMARVKHIMLSSCAPENFPSRWRQKEVFAALGM